MVAGNYSPPVQAAASPGYPADLRRLIKADFRLLGERRVDEVRASDIEALL